MEKHLLKRPITRWPSAASTGVPWGYLPLTYQPVSSRMMVKKLKKVVKGVSIKKLYQLEWWIDSRKIKIRDNFKSYTWIKKSTRKVWIVLLKEICLVKLLKF